MHGCLQAPRLAAIRTRPELRSVSKYDGTRAQTRRHQYTLTMDFMGAFRLLAGSVSKYDLTSSDMTSSIHLLNGFHRSIQALHPQPKQAGSQVSLKYDIISSDMTSSIHLLSELHAWTPSGSSLPTRQARNSGQTHNMTSRAQTDDFSCNSYLK